MNLRECRVLVIDRQAEIFTYKFDAISIVKPIVRPNMINKVAELLAHAGAEIEYTKGNEEMDKLTLKKNGLVECLRAILRHEGDTLHRRTLTNLRDDGLIEWDGKQIRYLLTDAGRDALILEMSPELPTESQQGVNEDEALADDFDEDTANAALEAQVEDEIAALEFAGLVTRRPEVQDAHDHLPKAEYTPTITEQIDAEIALATAMHEWKEVQVSNPVIVIPVPSRTERRIRTSIYDSLRIELNSNGGEMLLPALDALRETDPLLKQDGE